MMTGEVEVGGARIELLVGEMVKAHSGMTRTLADLETALDLLSSQWSGEAQRAYARAQADWNKRMGELHTELDRAQRNTTLANEGFTDAARAVRRMWSES
jgi:WXG100 family type VII secretion target